MIPATEANKPRVIPPVEKLFRQATHSPDSIKKHIKSKLNWPGQVSAIISLKNIVNKPSLKSISPEKLSRQKHIEHFMFYVSFLSCRAGPRAGPRAGRAGPSGGPSKNRTDKFLKTKKRNVKKNFYFFPVPLPIISFFS